jgi:hypothetical protein
MREVIAQLVGALDAVLRLDPGAFSSAAPALAAGRAVLESQAVPVNAHAERWAALAEAAERINSSAVCGPAEAAAFCRAIDALSAAIMGYDEAQHEEEPTQQPASQAEGARDAARWRLDVDESAIYAGSRRVLQLDTGTNNYGWREANRLGAELVERHNKVIDAARALGEKGK